MSAYHARGAISHNGDLIFLAAPADLLDRRVNICWLVISSLIVFRKNDRIFFFPFLTSSDPPVYGFFVLCSAVRIELFLVRTSSSTRSPPKRTTAMMAKQPTTLAARYTNAPSQNPNA